jgi:hypothetical protein
MSQLEFKLVLPAARVTRILLLGYLFVLATTFNYLTVGGLNLLYIGFALFLTIFLVIVWFGRTSNVFNNSMTMLLLYMTISYLLNFHDARLSSFLYSLFFIFTFLVFISFSIRFLNKEDLIRIAKLLLIAYLLVTIVGQIYVALGFFTQVLSPDDSSVHGNFGTAFSRSSNSIRYYSLSTEPSYSAIIVITLYYLYLELSLGLEGRRKRFWITIAVLYMILVFNSGYGFLLIGIFFWMQFLKQKPGLAVGGFLLLTLLLIVLFTAEVEVYSLARVKNILMNFKFNDWTSLRAIDYSASFRILPFYYYLKTADLASPEFYLGYGAGSSDTFLSTYLFPHSTDEVVFQGGFLPAFLIDYGILGFILFAAILIFEIRALRLFGLILIFFTLTNANFNTQLFWFVFTMLCMERKLDSARTTPRIYN